MAWEIAADGAATVRRVPPVDPECLRALERTLLERVSAVHDEACRAL